MYVDLAGLARYKSDFGAWARGGLLPKDAAAARVRTAKAGAVSLVPVQETPLDVSVDFLFTETPPASGDKGPGNPSTIIGVNEVKASRAGKNLLFPEDFECVPDRGLTATVNQDGSVSVSGTTVGNGILRFRSGGTTRLNTIKNSPFFPGLTYTVSMECPDSNVLGFVYYSNDGGITWIQAFSHFIGGQSRTFTVPADTTGLQFWTQTVDGITLNTTVKMQCELGETATAFEKGVKDTYTIPLGNTYYGGTLDAASGVMTVTHKHVQLTGANANIYFNEDIGTYNRFSITSVDSVRLEPAADYTNSQSCTHFNFAANWTLDAPHFYVATASPGTAYFYSDYATVDALNTWLAGQYQAGTPLEFVYPLATPYTVQLTPQQILSLSQSDKYTPRLNTVYSDAQAVQVGYLKHPSAASADLRNALVSLGGGV